MDKEKKCPKCDGEMEKAELGENLKALVEHVQQRGSVLSLGPFLSGDKIPGAKKYDFFVCSKCSLVENFIK